ncbi:MAG: hypothetical protein ABIJ59_19555 [Pseudomonadota bacterium]
MTVILSEKVKRTLHGGYSENLQGVQDQDKTKLVTTCLGKECDFSGYKRMNGGYLALWCGQQKIAVIDLRTCPNGKWQKDAKGFPANQTANGPPKMPGIV